MVKHSEKNRQVNDKNSYRIYMACQLIAQSLGVIFTHPFVAGEILNIENISRKEKLICRKVILKPQWWKSDNGPLLVTHKATHQFYVLLPENNGYIVLDPETLKREVVNANNADNFEPEAFVLVKSLASRAIFLKDLCQFAFKIISKDIYRIIAVEFFVNLLVLLIPIATASLFAELAQDSSHFYVWQWLTVLLFASVTITVLNISQIITDIRLRAKIDVTLQSGLWDRLLSLPIKFFHQYSIGDMAVRSNIVNKLIQNVNPSVFNQLINLVFSIIPLILMFYYNKNLAIIVFLLTVSLVCIYSILFKLQLKYFRDELYYKSISSSWIQQAFNSISKLFAAHAQERIFTLWLKYFKNVFFSTYKSGLISTTISVININFPIIIVLCIYYLVAANKITCSFSQFIGFSGTYTVFSFMILNAVDAIGKIMINIPYYELASPILLTSPEYIENSLALELFKGKIQLNNISFGYQTHFPVLEKIDFTVEAGSFVAIVGSSGCGKSTLFRLLAGFDQPWSGSILYDDYDMKILDVVSLRSKIGMVLQQSTLIPGTIFENLNCLSNLTVEEAWNLVKWVNLDQEIMKMPMKMHTYVSEWGKSFSSGQRQRLLIARALSNKPNILFLDEATSALDNSTQAIIHRHLKAQKITRIVIAQRMDAVKDADIIYVLKEGRIVESGSYGDLSSSNSYFKTHLCRDFSLN